MYNTHQSHRFGSLAALAVGVAIAAPMAQAQVVEFEEAEIYFELNDTDGDLGIHGFADGGPWKILELSDSADRPLLRVTSRRRLRLQGMTEIFFESAEPTFDEVRPDRFFVRFPEGTYTVSGVSTDGEILESEVDVSHTMAAPPANVTVNGQAAAADCDAVLPIVTEPVTIAWDAVTMSHSTIGNVGEAVTVQSYEIVAEVERPGMTPETLVFKGLLPPEVTAFELPEGITGLSDGELKFEIVTKLDNGNQTALESCFEID